MRIKTYLCEDVKEGMKKIKEDHGLDAIIVDIKNGGASDAKGCEIAVAVEDDSMAQSDDITESRRRTEAVWDHVIRHAAQAAGLVEAELIRDRVKTYPLPLRILFEKMIKNGVQKENALSIVSEVYCALGPFAAESPKAGFFVKGAISSRIKFHNPARAKAHIALLGPSGAGKTDTALKLVNLCEEEGVRASIVAFPAPDKAARDSDSFPEEIPARFDAAGRRLIVDLTGELRLQVKTAQRMVHAELLMVLPAGARDEKMKDCCDQVKGRNVAGLIFTKIDEEETVGHIFNNLLRLSLPLCYLTSGSAASDILTPDSDLLYKILIEGNSWKRRESAPLP